MVNYRRLEVLSFIIKLCHGDTRGVLGGRCKSTGKEDRQNMAIWFLFFLEKNSVNTQRAPRRGEER